MFKRTPPLCKVQEEENKRPDEVKVTLHGRVFACRHARTRKCERCGSTTRWRSTKVTI